MPTKDRCQKCEPGKYLLDVVRWPSINATEAEWPPQAPHHLVTWNARHILWRLRDCHAEGCPLAISYKIYKDYPETAYKRCTPASATTSTTCGKIVGMGIGNTADLHAGHDYLMVASFAGFYTGYFTLYVKPDGVNHLTFEMVEELSPREERVVLHWDNDAQLDLWVINKEKPTEKIGWSADSGDMAGGSGFLEVDNHVGSAGPETTILKSLTSGTAEVWVNNYYEHFSAAEATTYPATVDVFCRKCLNDLGQDTAGYVTSVTQQAEDVPEQSQGGGWWKVGQFVALDGFLLDGHPAVQWQTCTADCYSRGTHLDIDGGAEGAEEGGGAGEGEDGGGGEGDEGGRRQGKTQATRQGRSLQFETRAGARLRSSTLGGPGRQGTYRRRLLWHQNTESPVHGLNEECLNCPAGGTCSGGSQVKFVEGHTWGVRDGMHILIDCPTGHKVINTTAAATAFSHDSQKCEICAKGEECTESICTSCKPCSVGYYKPTSGTQACLECPANTYVETEGSSALSHCQRSG